MDPESTPKALGSAKVQAEPLLACLPDLERAAQAGDPSLASAAVQRFRDAARESGLLINFNWGEWQDEARKLLEDPRRLNKAGLEDISRLLTTCIRKERFVEGQLEELVSCGQLLRVVRRLQDLSRAARGPGFGT